MPILRSTGPRPRAAARCRFFEPEMDAQMQERRSLERDLRSALRSKQFELHYQPIVDLKSSRINGCEALIRWRHPDSGAWLRPSQFIPLAEEIGLHRAAWRMGIRQACAVAATWPDALKVAVNLSPASSAAPASSTW